MVQPAVGGIGGLWLIWTYGPVEERKKCQFTALQIHTYRRHWLNRSSAKQHVAQAKQSGTGRLINRTIAGQHIAQRNLVGESAAVLCREVGHRQCESRQSDNGRGATKARQTPRQHQGKQRIQNQHRQSCDQEKRCQIALCVLGQPFDGYVSGPAVGLERIPCAKHIAGKNLIAVLINTRSQIKTKRRIRQALASDTG